MQMCVKFAGIKMAFIDSSKFKLFSSLGVENLVSLDKETESGYDKYLFEFLEGFISISSDIAQGDLGLLSHLLDIFGELFATLTGQLGKNQADHSAIICRVDADIRS